MLIVQTMRDFLGMPLATGSTSATVGRLPGSQSAEIEKRCCDWVFSHSVYQAWRSGDTPSPALWVYGPPGSGKSTLCRRVIDAIQEEPSVSIASHYFRFDQNYTTLDVLRSLTSQLLESYLSGQPSSDFVEKLAQFADDRTKDSTTRVLSILQELTLHLPAAHFFLDGVDEEVAKLTNANQGPESVAQNALDVLGVLDGLVALNGEGRSNVRLWISSQNVQYTRQNFKAYTPFDIKDAVRSGIRCYLTRSVEDLSFIPQEQRDSILHQLLGRVESNFLWARLIIVELLKATNQAEMDEILEEGRAQDLDTYYCRFLNKLLQGNRASVAR